MGVVYRKRLILSAESGSSSALGDLKALLGYCLLLTAYLSPSLLKMNGGGPRKTFEVECPFGAPSFASLIR